MTEFFDRNGKRMTMMSWARAWENPNYRVLGSHSVGNLWISTVWLGIDHDSMNLFRDEPAPPLIFESMIFAVPQGDDRWDSLEVRRYRTEQEAMVGHTDLVHIANAMVDVEKEVMGAVVAEAMASTALDGETQSFGREVDDDPHDSDRDVHLLPEAQGGEAEPT